MNCGPAMIPLQINSKEWRIEGRNGCKISYQVKYIPDQKRWLGYIMKNGRDDNIKKG